MDPRHWTGARLALATAAHHFLLTVVPFRSPDSNDALAKFAHTVRTIRLSALEVEAVLLRCLSILERHAGGRLPSLVDRFLAMGGNPSDLLVRFQRCIDDILRFRGIRDPLVQGAIAILTSESGDSGLKSGAIAMRLGVSASQLDVRFKKATGLSPTEYLQSVRLDRAATRLLGSVDRIKEVWSEVGYNYPSNFNHDFKRRFGISPRQYRARTIMASTFVARVEPPHGRHCHSSNRPVIQSKENQPTVLIVDDDLGTLETIGRYLRIEGYRVETASTGAQAIEVALRCAPRRVLLDCHLPDMDGRTCARRLLSRNPELGSRLVLFTADLNIESNDPNIQALGIRVLSKLCDLEDVLEAVEAA